MNVILKANILEDFLIYLSSLYLFGVGSRKTKIEEHLVKPVSQKVVSLSQRVQQPGVRSLAQLREDRFKRLGGSLEQQGGGTVDPKVVKVSQHVEKPGVRSLAQLREDRFKRLGSSLEQEGEDTGNIAKRLKV